MKKILNCGVLEKRVQIKFKQVGGFTCESPRARPKYNSMFDKKKSGVLEKRILCSR